MKFQYFTFFLNPISVLFEDKRDKIQILKTLLTKNNPLFYKHRGSHLAYVFKSVADNYVMGRVGRKAIFKKNLSPIEKFEEKEEENWPYCDLIFNLDTDSNTGQKIVFEYKGNVFSNPYEQLKLLSEEINQYLISSGYVLAINPVTTEQEFWNLVGHYKGQIEKLTLSFNAPNLFKLTNNFNSELKEAQREYNLTKTTVEFENLNGKLEVPEDDKFIREGVDYIARGGGQYALKIKGKGRKVISSKNNIKVKSFDIEEMELVADNPELLKRIAEEIFD